MSKERIKATLGENLRLCPHYLKFVRNGKRFIENGAEHEIYTNGEMWFVLCQICREAADRRGLTWEEFLDECSRTQ